MFGVSKSPLTKDFFDGKKTQVPVGQTPLTNTSNPEALYGQALGREIINITIDDFEAVEPSMEGKALGRDEQYDDIVLQAPAQQDAEEIVAGYYDPETGVLQISRYGRMIEISGFPLIADLGRGLRGPRGEDGNDGNDGQDAFDGDDGEGGCAGPEGAGGEAGIAGQDGQDGERGDPGPPGARGPRGERGDLGPMGKIGYEGARGPRGSNCDDTAGADGIPGETPSAVVVISDTAPEQALIWGKLV